jgi:hypothetical protein
MNPIPWWKSPVYIGIAVSIVSAIFAHAPKVAAAFGLIDQASINAVVTDIFNGIGFLALIYAERKRANSTTQPLTLTQKSADAKTTPATQLATDINTQLTAKAPTITIPGDNNAQVSNIPATPDPTAKP